MPIPSRLFASFLSLLSFALFSNLFGVEIGRSLAFACNNNRQGWSPFLTTRHQQGLFGSNSGEPISCTSPSSSEVKNVDRNNNFNVKTSQVLSLSSIRSTLIRQEETIIFGLIERAQFRSNSIVYKKNGFGNFGLPDGVVVTDETTRSELENLSFLEYMLVSTVRGTMLFLLLLDYVHLNVQLLYLLLSEFFFMYMY